MKASCTLKTSGIWNTIALP